MATQQGRWHLNTGLMRVRTEWACRSYLTVPCFNDAFRSSTTLTYCRMIGELKRVQKEKVVALFKVISLYLCEGVDGRHENSLIQKIWSVGRLVFEPGTSRTQSVHHLTLSSSILPSFNRRHCKKQKLAIKQISRSRLLKLMLAALG